jgi:hypothetical protein
MGSSKNAASKNAANKRAAQLKDAVNWSLLARAGLVVARRWTALSSKERARLARLLRNWRGRTSNLSTRERVELRKLVRKLDLKGVSRELMLLRGGGKRRKRG